MADKILTPCNVARSWYRFRQVTAPCNVVCGSGVIVSAAVEVRIYCPAGREDIQVVFIGLVVYLPFCHKHLLTLVQWRHQTKRFYDNPSPASTHNKIFSYRWQNARSTGFLMLQVRVLRMRGMLNFLLIKKKRKILAYLPHSLHCVPQQTRPAVNPLVLSFIVVRGQQLWDQPKNVRFPISNQQTLWSYFAPIPIQLHTSVQKVAALSLNVSHTRCEVLLLDMLWA